VASEELAAVDDEEDDEEDDEVLSAAVEEASASVDAASPVDLQAVKPASSSTDTRINIPDIRFIKNPQKQSCV
jgi:hypothetical protein